MTSAHQAGMTPERWARIKSALADALEMHPERRAAYLGELRSADSDLAGELESLLGSYERLGDALEQGPLGLGQRLPEGALLGPYRILGSVGAGGMGQVYRAQHVLLRREVAIKVLHFAGSLDPAAKARLQREARAIAALSHPNVVDLHDFGEHEGVVFAAMELLEGETLRDRLRRGRLDWKDAARVVTQMADGLAAAHARGIVHRDVKPENTFLTRSGGLKLLDFGLARWTLVGASATGGHGDSVTSHDGFVGTPSYMAPEQLRGKPVDPKADLFSLGCVLYEACSGVNPFRCDNPGDTVVAVLTRQPRPLKSLGVAVPRSFEAIIQKCLEKDPAARRLTSERVATLLREEAGSPDPRRRLAPRQVAAACSLPAIALGLGVAGLMLARPRNVPVRPFQASDEAPAGAVVAKRLPELSGPPSMPPSQRGAPRDPEAYRLYLWGRSHLAKRTPAGLALATAFFEQASTRDPSFALALAGLSAAYSALPGTVDGIDPSEPRRRARVAAKQVMELDPQLADGYVALALVTASADWDWVSAERGFRRALELEPDHAWAHRGYAVSVLLPNRRFREARAHLERALELDPLSLATAEALGRVAYFQRDYVGAVASWRGVLEIEPHYAPARWGVGQALLAQGQPQAALDVFEPADQASPGAQRGRALIAYAHAAAGRPDRARRMLAALKAERARRYVAPSLLGLVHAGLNEPGAAFEWLERGCRERAEWMNLLDTEPLLDPIRGDPRFAGLLECVGLGRWAPS